MKVEEAQKRVDELNKMLINLKAINSYLLKKTDYDLEEISIRNDMTETVEGTMRKVIDEISTIKSRYLEAIYDATIKEIVIR